jgi:hypothetical protein
VAKKRNPSSSGTLPVSTQAAKTATEHITKPNHNTALPTQPPRKKPKNIVWLWVSMGVISLVAVGALIALFIPTRANNVASPPIKPSSFGVGPVTACQRQPLFVNGLGFKQVSINTIEYTVKGMLLFDSTTGTDPKDPKTKTYRHETWDDAGYMHAHMLDRNGNIYLIPAPRVDLFSNPPEKQNVLYVVDDKTGVMKAYLDLPYERAPSQLNPYGLMGLGFDCDTNGLYVSSVAGSSRNEELGRIFRVDLSTGKITDQLEYMDVLGIGVFNTPKGKRLYFGKARTPEIHSIALDNAGNFVGDSRLEFSIVGLDPSGADKGRRIQFRTVGNERSLEMIIDTLKFNYNLVPPSSQSLRLALRYVYEPNTDTWKFMELIKR